MLPPTPDGVHRAERKNRMAGAPSYGCWGRRGLGIAGIIGRGFGSGSGGVEAP